jgi:3'-phosphoadenosine 5'-phosphosulfate sulfotransferase (PAPS reductase)/FAD synthetase
MPDVANSAARFDETVNELNPDYIIALFSGGGDSTASTHLVKNHPRFSFALKIDTGIGVPETNEYVRETCAAWGVELREYKATEYVNAKGENDPQVYRDFVLRWGFPGPAGHGLMFQRLKQRPLYQALRDLGAKRGATILLVSGCRSDESQRRMANTRYLQQWEGQRYFVAPIWDWTKADVNSYLKANDIKPNPVIKLIHKSGECLCGAFAKRGELDELRLWFPDVAAEIDEIEAAARAAGFPWGWEDTPPAWFTAHKAGQEFLPGLVPEGVLCSSCIRD